MKTVLFLLILLVPFTAQAADEWTKLDTTLQLTYSGILIADWVQTLEAAKNRTILRENGFAQRFIGEYPSKRDVNYYFASVLVGNFSVSYLLRKLWPDKPYTTIWQSINIVVEYDTYQKNRKYVKLSLHY